MKKSSLASVLVFILIAVTAGAASAHEGHGQGQDDTRCSELLNPSGSAPEVEIPQGPQRSVHGRTEFMTSGRDVDLAKPLQEAAEIIFGKDGVAAKLGLALPPHHLEMAPSQELAALAVMGRHAVPHWHDGSQLSTRLGGVAGVLEFVTPGCPTCRSYYRDTTSKDHQISVMMHVAGHNDFSVHSMYCSIRGCDPIAESLHLFDLMEKLYRQYDHDEVSQWYQYLLSFDESQDLARGTFDSPESLRPENLDGIQSLPKRVEVGEGGQLVYPSRKHPRTSTASVLQAIVANLPPTTPQWKRQMAEIFERMYRVYGYYMSTKIMNEGWASLMQELIAEHAPWQTTHYAIEHGSLMRGVAYPSLSNPYWLGREAWRNLRRRFNDRPEIKGLAPLERDRKFVAYAHTLIHQLDDYGFLRTALDDQWVYKHKLFLSRKATDDEYDRNLAPPPNDGKPKEQKVVVSRDGQRVVDYLARQIADKSRQVPRILLEDVSGYGKGVVALRHDVIDNVPLLRQTMGPYLYVMAQTMAKPVSLLTVKSSTWSKPKSQPQDGWGGGWGGWGRWSQPEPKPEITPIRVEVEANGTVHVYDRDSRGAETLNEALTRELQDSIDGYRLDGSQSVNDDLFQQQEEYFGPPQMSQALDGASAEGMPYLSHSPTAPRAIWEYLKMVEKRLLAALNAAVQGKVKVKSAGSRVRLKVLPDIPKLRLDQQVAKKLKDTLPPAPVDLQITEHFDAFMESPKLNLLPNTDDNVDIGQGDKGKPGRKWWGDKQDEGEGDGDDDGDPSDDDGDPTDEPGKKPGKGGSKDPSEVEIPLEVYGEFLMGALELPNLKPKGDKSDRLELSREGGIHRPYGNILWERMGGDALTLGRKHFDRLGIDPKTVDKRRILKEGFKLIQPNHYIVSDSDPTPHPEMNAVVVIVLDLTGSMHGRPQALAKEFVFNLRALLKAQYKHVEFRFVGYDSQAHEFPESQIFKAYLGGGNTDSEGFKLANQILTQYPKAQYNRFVFGIGDGGSSDMQTHEELKKIMAETEFSGWLQTTVYGDSAIPAFVEPIKQFAQQTPEIFGFSHLEDSNAGVFKALKALFGKNRLDEQND